jgi:hypothetical protein
MRPSKNKKGAAVFEHAKNNMNHLVNQMGYLDLNEEEKVPARSVSPQVKPQMKPDVQVKPIVKKQEEHKRPTIMSRPVAGATSRAKSQAPHVMKPIIRH